jgi:hypothetical protein
VDNPSPDQKSLIEWHAAFRAVPGEVISGDLHVVVPFSNGVLVAVIDGLGHGELAAAAAGIAANELSKHWGGSLVSLLSSCHNTLRGSRGAVMNIACLSARPQRLSWLGVGNVEGVLLRADPAARPTREYLHQRPGIVGQQLPSVEESVVPLFPGDTLVFATDGIKSSFISELNFGGSPRRMADDILLRSGKEWDDALVLVARYLGASQ